jgi:hypothetical protein
MSSPWDLLAMTAACRLGVEMSSRLSDIRSPLSAGAPRTCQHGWRTLADRNATLRSSRKAYFCKATH